MSTAKFTCGPAVGGCPEKVYPYCIARMHESAPSRDLRLEGAEMARSQMMGAPDVAALLRWLVTLTGSKNVLEVGCFRGTTTLWLAEGVPKDGHVTTLDCVAEFAEAGRKQWQAAGVADRITLREGKAAETMEKMLKEEGLAGTFDLVFVDADKLHYPVYYELGLKLLRPNGIMAVDNTLWSGKVATVAADAMDEDTRVLHDLNDTINEDKRVESILLPLADGLTLARKLPPAQ